jgi:5-(carboxyamino)imidazole ribonucleotide mutase
MGDVQPLVGVVFGSQSDSALFSQTEEVLRKLEIPFETVILSAHRRPDDTRTWALSAADRGLHVIIAGAGGAAHLPGVIASWTTLPVIGVPVGGGALAGVDSLLSIVQMPAGVPVATVAVGTAGARNAAYLAAQILSIKYDDIARRLRALKAELATGGRG